MVFEVGQEIVFKEIQLPWYLEKVHTMFEQAKKPTPISTITHIDRSEGIIVAR